jgi:alpha-tubulin suppressor-like RCC1 family protein
MGTLTCWNDGFFLANHLAHEVFDFGRVALFDKSFSNRCALNQLGVVWCSRLTLEDVFSGQPKRPQVIAGLSGTRQLAVAQNHACALLADDSVYCWGDNESGQLGDGTDVARSSATKASW